MQEMIDEKTLAQLQKQLAAEKAARKKRTAKKSGIEISSQEHTAQDGYSEPQDRQRYYSKIGTGRKCERIH